MAVIIKKDSGESIQQLINKFKRATMDDPGLEQAKTRQLVGYMKPSAVRNEANKLRRKESARLRRRAKRLRGVLK